MPIISSQVLDFLSPMPPLSFEAASEVSFKASIFSQYPAKLSGKLFVFFSSVSWVFFGFLLPTSLMLYIFIYLFFILDLELATQTLKAEPPFTEQEIEQDGNFLRCHNLKLSDTSFTLIFLIAVF